MIIRPYALIKRAAESVFLIAAGMPLPHAVEKNRPAEEPGEGGGT